MMATPGMQEPTYHLPCPSCLDELSQLKVLGCKHAFCTACLLPQLSNNRIECVVCGEEHVFTGRARVEDLPGPLDISHIQEELNTFLSTRHTGKVRRTCDACEDQKEAIGHCHTCMKNLCESCFGSHKKHSISKLYILLPLSDSAICSDHTKELITLYCKDCTKGLCAACVSNGHEKHRVININDKGLVHSQKIALGECATTVIKNGAIIDEQLTEVKSLPSSLDEKYKSAMKSVQTVMEKLVEAGKQVEAELQQELAREKERIALYRSELEDVKSTQERFLSHLDTIQASQSGADIVQIADNLPSISTKSSAISQIVKVPVVEENNDFIEQVKSLVRFDNVSLKSMKSPETERSSSPNPQQHKSEATDQKDGALGKFEQGPRTRRGRKAKSPAAFLPLIPSPTADELWEVRIEHSSALTYDPMSQLIYFTDRYEKDRYTVRYRISAFNLSGVLQMESPTDSQSHGGLCMDSTRDVLVGTHDKKILCIDKSGKQVREISVVGAWSLQGIVYCEESNLYIVTDNRRHCLWFVDAERGQVVRRVGSYGDGDSQFRYPQYIAHTKVSSTECHIAVSDSGNNCVKIFSATGQFVRKFGCLSFIRKFWFPSLLCPCGVCFDPQGRLLVCDGDNRQVVRFRWEGANEYRDTVLTPEHLDYGTPNSILITPEGHLVVRSGNIHIFCFSYPA